VPKHEADIQSPPEWGKSVTSGRRRFWKKTWRQAYVKWQFIYLIITWSLNWMLSAKTQTSH